jgi:hypothetical protein
MRILCISHSIFVEYSHIGEYNFHVELLVTQEPVAEFYAYSLIS